MRLEFLRNLRSAILETYGLDFEMTMPDSPGGHSLRLSLRNVEEILGVGAVVSYEWTKIEGVLTLGNFNKQLLEEIQKGAFYEKPVFRAYLGNLEKQGIGLKFVVDGKAIRPLELEDVPEKWSDFSVRMKKIGLGIDKNDGLRLEELFFDWGMKCAELFYLILPLPVTMEDLASDNLGLPEGAVCNVKVNRYERNPVNRKVCIDFFGTLCSVCGIDFSSLYGDLGKGFIHVHHIVPVSKIGPDYLVDPLKDLVSVCPNCHSMLHRKDPPLLPEDLRLILVNQALSRQRDD